MILPVGFGSSAGGTPANAISRSLRFNSADSAYLNRTFSSAGNRRTWTWSAWVKRSFLDATATSAAFQTLFHAGVYTTVAFSADKIYFQMADGAGGAWYIQTSQVFRDPSAWYHIVAVLNTPSATASQRMQLYINGVEVTAFSTDQRTSITQSTTSGEINNNISHAIGSNTTPARYFPGYLTEINFVDSPVLAGSTTNASTTVTLTTGTTTNIGIGWNVGGTNIPSGATVSSITNSTQFVISSAATATGSSINIGVTPPVSAFGETDSNTGVWKPKAYTGTYGTNGFELSFADNSGTTSTTLGADTSGNGNNWTSNNFSVTAGAGNDSLVDSPTSYGTDTGVGGEVRGNYATMNPLQYSSTYVTLNNGNLNVTGSSGVDAGGAFGTAKVNSGKWYWEATIVAVSGTYPFIGFAVNTSGTQYQGGARVNTSGTLAIASPESFITLNGSPSGTSFTTNDVLQFALDMDNGKMWIGKNGTWMNSGVPASGTGNVFSISDRTQFVSPFIFSYNSSQVAYNFGQRAFEKWNGSAYVANTAPSGFKALCTQNLSTPTIGATSTTQANDYFNTVIYTGTAPSTQAVTGVGFQPDFVWVKSRSIGVGSLVYDAVRGAGSSKALQTNSTDPEGLGVNVTAASSRGYISSFDSDGFTAADGTTSGQYSKANTSTYVSWNWKANGAGSSNTDGQITSTVSANNDAGFSIVTYTGNGSANQTVGHGCKVGGVATAPVFGILKDRDTNSNNNQWQVFHTAAGDKYAYLSTTAAFAGTAEFYPTSGSSTTVTIARGSPAATTNESGDRYVMYLFAPVAGYSAFGSYTGNAAADGPFIYTGFRPEYVMIKASTASGDWVIEDTMRSPYNVSTNYVTANSFAAETTGQLIDFLSNGFKIRVAVSSAINGSGTTYIYAAFAENPFKYSLAR